jgi:signal transduction histidine kinase
VLRRKLVFVLCSLVVLLLVVAVGSVITLQGMLHELDHTQTWEHHRQLASQFRWVVLALTVVFLLVVNFSVVVLLRAAGMVLRPLEALVQATRELARENFHHRIEAKQQDEFDELAYAYNHMAEQLEANEQRKLEMVSQTALALNHELNNAASIIELQLQLLSRQSAGNPTVEKYARQIHDSLERMTNTVESLKHIRRIVLTEYISGVKMLDLERSVEDNQIPTEASDRAGLHEARQRG